MSIEAFEPETGAILRRRVVILAAAALIVPLAYIALRVIQPAYAPVMPQPTTSVASDSFLVSKQ